jgi:tetratricopeptide (TPR) repeat protein
MENSNIKNHEIANLFFISKKYDKAIEYYLLIIDYDKQYIIYSNIAACYLSLKNYLKALDYGLKSVENNIKYSIGWGRVGSAYKGLQKYDESFKAFQIALLLDNNNINYKNEINFFNKENNINLDKNLLFNLFLNNSTLLLKLKNKDFRDSILNIKNPLDILNNKEIISILDTIIPKLKKL